MSIGTLNEGSLHNTLKEHYWVPGAAVECPVDGYIADLVVEDRIIEIQTGSFSSLKTKLPRLLQNHKVTLVWPLAVIRTIVKCSPDGEPQRRKSPRRGSIVDLFSELVAIPELLNHQGFTIDVVSIHEEEFRVYDGRRGRRRRGWVVTGRRLVDVLETTTVKSMNDLLTTLGVGLPRRFTTLEISEAVGRSRRVGQQIAYCLRKAGVTRPCGKLGNSIVYERTNP